MENKLISLLKLGYNLDDFYNVTIWNSAGDYDIALQGYFSNEIVIKYMNLGFEFTKKDDTRFIAIKDRVKIIFI